MSLLADLDAAGPSHRGRRCDFRAWLDSRSEEEQAAVRAKIGSSIPAATLADIITANGDGYSVSESTIANHRRNGCMTCRS